MLDTATLRVAFGAIALTLFLLFYGVIYRRTRAPYSGWWSLALLLFPFGAAGYLLDGTTQQVWANPAANSLLVAGAASVWAAARSLSKASPKRWLILPGPAVTAVASALDHPASNDWAGGPVFLGLMCVLFALAYREVRSPPAEYAHIQVPLAIAAGFLAAYYLGRWAAFLAEGPHGAVFVQFFGSQPTTFITMLLLVVASFSMAALNNEEVAKDLRIRANRDPLTGLLNRAGFLDLAAGQIQRTNRLGRPASLILADLDHFKTVNDTYGHPAGDLVLQAFAAACNAEVRSGDLVGRFGGEEFIILLPGTGIDTAKTIATRISRTLQATDTDSRHPTVSYGIASAGTGTARLEAMIEAADAALYRAKSQGRDRVVHAAD
nr:GGDEF domain-containing protein [Arthrobacter sp. fls2-241-R2A-200]